MALVCLLLGGVMAAQVCTAAQLRHEWTRVQHSREARNWSLGTGPPPALSMLHQSATHATSSILLIVGSGLVGLSVALARAFHVYHPQGTLVFLFQWAGVASMVGFCAAYGVGWACL